MDNNFIMFALASLMLNITPGSDMLYVASQSTGQGTKAGIISALGITAGCFVHIAAAVLGLSAIISQSAFAFNLLKYLGAAYLIYLGIKMMMAKYNAHSFAGQPLPVISLRKIFWRGFLTNVVNPKVALFFLAFLPQFIAANEVNPQLKIVLLGSYFNLSGMVVNIAVALLFGKMGSWLSSHAGFMKWQQKVSGFVLLLLGIKVALSSKK